MSGSNEGEGSGGHWSSDLSFRAFLSTLPSISGFKKVRRRLSSLPSNPGRAHVCGRQVKLPLYAERPIPNGLVPGRLSVVFRTDPAPDAARSSAGIVPDPGRPVRIAASTQMASFLSDQPASLQYSPKPSVPLVAYVSLPAEIALSTFGSTHNAVVRMSQPPRNCGNYDRHSRKSPTTRNCVNWRSRTPTTELP